MVLLVLSGINKSLIMTDPLTALVGKSFGIAATAHNGQYRRDGTTPYIKHPMAVADRVIKYGYEYVCVAYLHDVLEDTNVTYDILIENGIPENIVKAVEILTKGEDQNYDEYLYYVKSNEVAKRVKIADILSNLADDPTDKQIIKYAKALTYLMS